MQEDVAEIVFGLIDQYELHQQHMVNLEPLEALFPRMERDLTDIGIDGFVIPPGVPISDDNPAVVTVNKRLTRNERRLVYAHEIGHALHGHAGAFRMDDIDAWFVDREEREAWTIAARLLVPMAAVTELGESRRIASACCVPEWLVGLAI